MYGVIYWSNNDNRLDIVENLDGSVWIAESMEEADKKAEEVESSWIGVTGARTISLEGVSP